MALLAKDEAALERVLIQPLMSGWRCTDGAELRLAEAEKPIAGAILKHMWALCNKEWTTQQTPDTASPAAGTTPPSSAKSGSDEKVPKQLPPGVWAQLINAYKPQQIQGQDRTFPIQEVIGADQTLARIYQ